MALSSLGSSELSSIASVLQQPADSFGNDPQLEMLWAVKAYEHAEIYFNLLRSVDPKLLRLCPVNDDIYMEFRKEFGDLAVDKIDETAMKSKEGKEKWRAFCNKFEGQVADWNMATLLRMDSKKDISEENTIIVPRIQFLAIEIARNRDGFNSDIRRLYGNKESNHNSSCDGT